jgi:hypothetical protein
MLSPRAAAAVSAAALVARVLLAAGGAGEELSARVELSSPADSVLRLREGWALANMGQSPYGRDNQMSPATSSNALHTLLSEVKWHPVSGENVYPAHCPPRHRRAF